MARAIGGRADKDGNEFERLWIVQLGLRMLAGEVSSLTWEPAGPDGYGVEVEVALPDGRFQVHQCKIENGTKGRWSVADLAAAGVLGTALRHLRRPPVAEFVFVSRDPVPVLRDLAERSCRSNGEPELFVATALSSREHRDQFSRLCAAWELDPGTVWGRARAVALLARLRFEAGIWDPAQRSHLELTAGLLAQGLGREIVSSLVDFLSTRLGKEVYGDQLREHLRGAGHLPRDLRGDPNLPGAVERLHRSFEGSLAPLLLGGELLPRPEAQVILDLLDDPGGPKVIFVHGPPGIGKSDAMLEVARTLTVRGTPLLAIRLDAQRPAGSLSHFSREVLELPVGEPAHCLAVLAGGRPAVLILDQLDALRWTGAHSSEALRICREIVEGAVHTANLRVVLACRSFDLDNDPMFNSWQRELEGHDATRAAQVEVGPLSLEQVESFLTAQGCDYLLDLSATQVELLRHPYTLFLWWNLVRTATGPPAFVSKTDLLAAYRRQLDWELGVRNQFDAQELLDRLVAYLDRHGRLDAPRLALGGPETALAALQSLNVIRVPRPGIVTFTHQSLLDFLIAERVAREALQGSLSVMAWIRLHEQSLFRREQLQQLLTLLREQDPAQYTEIIEEILKAEDIRFHLKHLALGMLRHGSRPSRHEAGLVERLLGAEFWRQHLLHGYFTFEGRGWFEALDGIGALDRWLASGEEVLMWKALETCESVVAEVPERIARLLAPLRARSGATWGRHVDDVLQQAPGAVSAQLFARQLKRLKADVSFDDFHAWLDGVGFARRDPERGMIFLATYLERALDDFESENARAYLRSEPSAEYTTAAQAAPEVAWRLLLPLLVRASSMPDARRPSGSDSFLGDLQATTQQVLIAAGSELAKRGGRAFLDRLAPLRDARSKCLERVVLFSLLAAPDALADFALQWLSANKRRLELGTQEDRGAFEPARRLIERFAGRCSTKVYQRLEARLLGCRVKEEIHDARLHRQRFQPRGRLVTLSYGKVQHVLLSTLPHERMSREARERLAGWNAKFGESGWTCDCGERIGVYKPVRDFTALLRRATGWSDRLWGLILEGKWSQARMPPGVDALGDEGFAWVLRSAAWRQPRRFATLLASAQVRNPVPYLLRFLEGFVEDRPARGASGATAAWTPADVGMVEEVLAHFAVPLQDDEVARVLCRLVAKRGGADWSDATVDQIRSYAERPEPCCDWGPHNSLELPAEDSLRCAAIKALMHLTHSKSELWHRCLPTLERLVADPDPVVRCMTPSLCLTLYHLEPAYAIELFVRCCDHHDDRVLDGQCTAQFLRWTCSKDPELLTPMLKRMLLSRNPNVASKGAAWVSRVNLQTGLWSDLSPRLARADWSRRAGFAEALADFAIDPEYREATLPQIMAMFEDRMVVEKLLPVLRHEAVIGSPDGPGLALAFVDSNAFEWREQSEVLFIGLRGFHGSLLPYATVIRHAVDRLISMTEDGRGDQNRDVPGGLLDVLLLLYEQAEEQGLSEVRALCLDAWDRFLSCRWGRCQSFFGKMSD